jgi:hypothetical protein
VSGDTSPSARFRRMRALTRACLVGGALLCVAAGANRGTVSSGLAQVSVAAGLTLLAATFVLYFRYCNRCPYCDESFSRAREYESTETSGLPLFGRIPRCPFCSQLLDAEEGS